MAFKRATKATKKKPPPVSGAARIAAHVARHNACKRRECADPERRARLEQDGNGLAWLAHYMPGAFGKPFGQMHEDIAAAFDEAVQNGNWCVVAAPRGSGKTTTINGLSLRAAIAAIIRFVAVIPWKEKDALRALRFWKTNLCGNKRLLADYPEICVPFSQCRGNSQRLASIHWTDAPEPTGAQLVLSDGLIVLPGSVGVLGSASLGGNPRGMQFTLDDGTVIRPDVLLIDDPSDKKTARSIVLSQANVEKIREDVLGMAGPGTRIAAVMPGTRIAARDTISHFLDDEEEPDWASVVVPQITSWPDERGEEGEMPLWEEWNRLRIAGRDDELAEAHAYYIEHGEAMRAGMTVSWDDRFDAEHGDPDAYWAAMADYYRMGRKAFLQERQNAPEEEAAGILVLKPEQVATRTGDFRRGEWPEDASIVVAGIDVGTATALNWCVAASTPALAVWVPDYGTYPGGNQPLWTPESSQPSSTAIRAGIKVLVRQLIRRFPALQAIGIDGNYATQLVYEVCKELREETEITIVPCRGVGSTKFRLPQLSNRSKLRAMGEQCHGYKGDKGEEVWFNSHHWHRLQQEAFTTELGSPGSIQLPHGGRHDAMSLAICADYLIRVEIRADGKEVQVWGNDSKYENHLSDAMVIALVQANLEGASASGTVPKSRQGKPKRPKSYSLARPGKRRPRP